MAAPADSSLHPKQVFQANGGRKFCIDLSIITTTR